jgi:crotonobetainyl-CoA:carnitine CoA-transferase CaiB-like acyl-CoA transferase
VLGHLGLTRADAGGTVAVEGGERPEVGPHRLAAAATGALVGLGVAVAALHRERGGPGQDVRVDTARALQALRTIRYATKNGRRLPIGEGPLSRYNQAGDGRWLYVYATHVLGSFLDAALDVLQCPHTPAAIEAAFRRWDGLALEEALNERGVPAAMVRTDAEWADHPQGRWLAARPVVELGPLGDAPPEPLARADRPLAGVRVVDLTHALCGPYASRALAEHGAEVLRLAPTTCRDPEAVLLDTGWGKRSAYVDLDDPADVALVRDLVADADVVVQSFRPGALDRRGLSAEDLAAVRPGLVHLTASGYGDDGPWGGRRAFESLGQSVAGITAAEAAHTADGRPRSVRLGTLNDYLAAYLGAAGVVAALRRRARTGGGHRVRVSLAGASMWVRSLGEQDLGDGPHDEPYVDLVTPRILRAPSPSGELAVLAPVVELSATPGRWDTPSEPLGASLPRWSPRR